MWFKDGCCQSHFVASCIRRRDFGVFIEIHKSNKTVLQSRPVGNICLCFYCSSAFCSSSHCEVASVRWMRADRAELESAKRTLVQRRSLRVRSHWLVAPCKVDFTGLFVHHKWDSILGSVYSQSEGQRKVFGDQVNNILYCIIGRNQSF